MAPARATRLGTLCTSALVLAAVLIFVGWQQRQHVIDFANGVKDEACGQSVTFLGVDVAMPAGWCQPA